MSDEMWNDKYEAWIEPREGDLEIQYMDENADVIKSKECMIQHITDGRFDEWCVEIFKAECDKND